MFIKAVSSFSLKYLKKNVWKSSTNSIFCITFFLLQLYGIKMFLFFTKFHIGNSQLLPNLSIYHFSNFFYVYHGVKNVRNLEGICPSKLMKYCIVLFIVNFCFLEQMKFAQGLWSCPQLLDFFCIFHSKPCRVAQLLVERTESLGKRSTLSGWCKPGLEVFTLQQAQDHIQKDTW